MSLVLTTHIFFTFFMAGLCWFVQLAHYPLMRVLPKDNLQFYAQKNISTGYVAIPAMTVEYITGIWVIYHQPDTLMLANGVGMLIIALSTFIYQAPIHLQLMAGLNEGLLTKLIRTNWIRTITWTFRSALLAWLMLNL